MTNVHAVIIDDNPQNLEVLSRLLAFHQVSCTAIQDGAQVEAVLRDVPSVDLVFLDLEMPGRSGYDLLAVLRNILGADTPVIACTVHSNEIAHTQALGFDSFIGKPLDPNLFARQLDMLLHGKAVWNAT